MPLRIKQRAGKCVPRQQCAGTLPATDCLINVSHLAAVAYLEKDPAQLYDRHTCTTLGIMRPRRCAMFSGANTRAANAPCRSGNSQRLRWALRYRTSCDPHVGLSHVGSAKLRPGHDCRIQRQILWSGTMQYQMSTNVIKVTPRATHEHHRTRTQRM